VRRAAIYTRLSKDRPDERSREDQEADCRALCTAKGYEVVAVHTDLESGYRRTARRPGYQALVADLESGAVDAVVIWKLDRLTRQGIRQVAPMLDALEGVGATLLSVHDPIDTSTAMGEGVLGMLASMAKAESENISVRSRRAKRHYAEMGRHKDGGPRAFGLSPDWSTVVPEEVALIREAAERILAGESLRGVVLDWGRRDVETSTGRPFLVASLRSLLLQERLYGARVYKGRVVAAGGWPVILDELTCRRLRAVLTDPNRRMGAPVRSYLLTGFLRCSKCGGRMRSTAPASGKRKYACPPKPDGCGGTAILADRTEEELAAQVLAALDSPDIHAGLTKNDDGEDLAGAIADDETQLEELAKEWAAKRITRAEWLVARDAVQARLDVARGRLAENAVRIPVAVDLPGRWSDLTFDQRRAVLSAVVERVEVRPATRGRHFFDPERLNVVWRA
jgi:DNA invertase Pin-like site-specific DNA recombinase